MKYLQYERGYITRSLKKERKIRICVIIISLVLTIATKIIHGIFA